MKKSSLRCTATDTKGLQCGRMVRTKNLQPGQPILCTVHGKNPIGQQFTKSTDVDDLLDGLLKSRNENIVLRAIELKREIEKEKGQDDSAEARIEDECRRATDDDRDELLFHIGAIGAIRARMRNQAVCRPTLDELNAEARADEQIRIPVVPELAPEMIPPRPRVQPVEPVEEPSTTLPKDKWPAVGIYMTKHGPSHSAGDETAADVIAGTIPYEEALDRQQRLNRQIQTFTASLKEA